MATKILLDTDIGSDIDDAACLAYLLAQPQCELLGITTVTGATDQRAMLASVLCKVAGKEMPIYPGLQLPLQVQPRQMQVPQAAALERWPHDKHFPDGQAIQYMRQVILAHPGEVILLAIGPLTNVASLFTAHPDVIPLLKGLVLMGGKFLDQLPGQERVEWNILCDPHAAAVVYKANMGSVRSIGLDVTERVLLQASAVRQKFDRPLLRPVLDMAEVWFAQQEVLTFHDPLAAATIFDSQICHFAMGQVEVALTDDSLIGQTIWNGSAAGRGGLHEVAVDVSPERFFDHYFSVFD